MTPRKTLNKTRENVDGHKHNCALCPYSTKDLGHYKCHLKITHSNEKPFKCPECPFNAKWKQAVKVHVKNVHILRSGSSLSRPFPCPHFGCSYAAKQKVHLNQHLKIHSDQRSFVCYHPDCNYSTVNQGALTVHTQTHTGEKPYGCQFESFSYAAASSSDFVRYLRIHTGEKPFKCPEPNCEYSAARVTHLKPHQLNHHPKPDPEEGESEQRPSFSCPLCEYKGKSKAHLSKLAESHTLEKLFKCEEPNCNYEAKRTEHLKNHKLSKHSDEKPFKCPLESCAFRCKIKWGVYKHLKSHSAERRYKRKL